MTPLELTESRTSPRSRASYEAPHASSSHHPPSHSHPHAAAHSSHAVHTYNAQEIENPLERTSSPRPETIRSVKAAGYASPVPVGDGALEAAVAPFHPKPDDAVPIVRGGHELDEAARIQELIGPPPDGGRDAWLCVVAAFGQQFAMFGLSEYFVGGECVGMCADVCGCVGGRKEEM